MAWASAAQPRAHVGEGLAPALEDGPPHPLQRPEEIDRGGPGGSEPFDRRFQIGQQTVEGGGAALARGQRDTEGGGDADGGRAPHDQRADGVGHVLPAPVLALHFLRGQAALVQHHQPIASPVDGTNHNLGVAVKLPSSRKS